MFRNTEFEVLLILLILFLVLSMMPVIELKYHNDLFETTETFNKYCLNNDIELLNELDVKDTYMWNMTNYLYDFDTVDTYLNDESQNTYKLQSITVDNGGSGYKSEPTVSIVSNDGNGSGASAKAVLTTTGAVSSITVDNGGSGYNSVPTVKIEDGGGGGATAKAVLSTKYVDTIKVVNGGSGYSKETTVSFEGGRTIPVFHNGVVSSIKVDYGGARYTSAPTVSISGGREGNAKATAIIKDGKVIEIKVENGGSYSSTPTVSIYGGGGSGARATAVVTYSIKSVEVKNKGSGYTDPPSVKIEDSDGGGNGALAIAELTTSSVKEIKVENGGSGYTSVPTVKIESGSGGGSGAKATAVITKSVNEIKVENGGSGYKNGTTVKIEGGGRGDVGKSATAKAFLDIDTNVSDYKWLPEMNSKIYLYYQNMSMAFFLTIIAFFCYSFFYIFKYHLEEDKICMYGDTDADVNDLFRYYLYALAIYILLFITFFSIILKKITEIYKTNDTETYEYIILMKGLDTILKENKITNEDNKEIIDILKRHSKNKINDIRYVAIHNKDAMYDLALAVKKKSKPRDDATTTTTESDIKNNYDNAEGKLIRLNNIDRLEYYNSDEAKNKVKGKVADIFRFIYAYIFFLIVPIYLLSVSLKGNYIYLLFTLIIMIVFSISVYNIYNTLQ